MDLILILVVQCWQEGDFYVFNSGLVHEVPAVVGDAKARIVLATFIGYSDDDGACMPLRALGLALRFHPH